MKANEQGLTTEERIMFAVLGIILVIAIGVLTLNYFSTHERKVEGTNTTEKGDQKDVVDNEENTTSKDDLKEVSNDNSTVTIKGLSNVTKTTSTTKLSKVTNTEKQNQSTTPTDDNSDEGIGSTDEGEVDDGAAILDNSENLDWTFNSNIVKESYANVSIEVPTTVILTDGYEKEAQVVIKENTTGNEMTIEDNHISLLAGEYTYYYTCNNQTKELPLTIYNKLDNTKIIIASVKDTYSNYNEELQYLIDNSTITSNDNTYNINIKRKTTINEVPLKVVLPDAYTKVESKTNGITVSNDNSIADLNNNEFIITLDLNTISLTKTNKILLTIDGIEYLFNFNITIENVEEVEEPNEENPEEENNNQEENKEEEEKDPEPTPEEPKPEEEVEEPTNGPINETPTNNNLSSEVEETPPDISLTT